MTDTIAAVFIDPFARTVTDVTLPVGEKLTWAAIKALVAPSQGLLERVHLADHGALGSVYAYVDECGNLMDWDSQAFFKLVYPYPLAGRAVIVREPTGSADGYMALGVPAAAIAPHVEWIAPQDVRMPAPTFQACDDNMNPIGEPKPLSADGVTEWNYKQQPK